MVEIIKSVKKKTTQKDATLVVNLFNLTRCFRDALANTKYPPFQTKSILCSCLKDGQQFVTSFMESMPLITELFNNSSFNKSIVEALGAFQKGTRQLHSICTHGKLHQDKSTASLVPNIRRSLEKFIFQTKAMMKTNSISVFLFSYILYYTRSAGRWGER